MNNYKSNASHSLFLLLASFTVLLLLILSSAPSSVVNGQHNVTLEGESVPLAEFSNSTGFNITFLSLDIEYDTSIGTNVSTFHYNVFWNATAGESAHVNLTSFALVVCPSLRFAIIDHDPLNATLEILETDDNQLLLSFGLSDFTPPSFNFSIIIQGEGSVVDGDFYVFNGTVSHANGTTSVPECITQAPGNASEVNCTADQGTCGDQCYEPEKYVCLNGFLCPVNTLRCGEDCYDRQEYVCINGTKLCQVETPLACGDACYSSEFYTCDENGHLHTIPSSSPGSDSNSNSNTGGGGATGEDFPTLDDETSGLWPHRPHRHHTIIAPEETAVVVPEETTVVVGEETIVPGEETVLAPPEETVVAGETVIPPEETVYDQW